MERTPVFSGRSAEAREEESGWEWGRLAVLDAFSDDLMWQDEELRRTSIKPMTVNVFYNDKLTTCQV